MKKICLILFFAIVCMTGGYASVKYEMRATLLGKVGEMEIEKRKSPISAYDCMIHVKSSGIAAFLSGHRSDLMHAKGIRKKGVYYSRNLYIETKKKKKRRLKEYTFSNNKKLITKRKRSWKNSSLISDSSRKLPYYTRMDPVGLYYAVVKQLISKPGSKREYKIAGVEKAGGKVEVIIPDVASQKALSRKYKTKGLLMIYMIVKGEVLGKKNRKVLMAMDRKSKMIEKAWLSSMPVVGTVTISRISGEKASASKK